MVANKKLKLRTQNRKNAVKVLMNKETKRDTFKLQIWQDTQRI